MATLTFTQTLGSDDPGSLFVEIPFEVKEIFGKARPPVSVTIKGHTWRSTVSVYGGKYYLPVRKENRDAARVKVGDRVKVTVASDEKPRTVVIPAALAKALKSDPAAKASWKKLSYSHQLEHAGAVEKAKKPETRTRRIASTLQMLKAKK